MISLRLILLTILQFCYFYSFGQVTSNLNSKFTVVIDAGHGGKDPGAVSPNKNFEKTVVLKVGDMPEQEYTIVGSLEADPLKKRISNESPIGKGIIGTKKGKTVTVKTETGREVKVKIVDVK